jgi:outer membrane protein assembly factor BamB
MSTIVIPTPFSAHGLLYFSSGYVGDTHRPAYAVRPGASGDITVGEPASAKFVAWYQPQGGTYNTSPIVYGDYFYTLYDRGFFTAHDARTGAEIYGKQRIDPEAGAFTASPWAYNGKIFALSEDGVTYVIRAGNKYELVGRNALDEFTLATPAIAGNGLIVRTASSLYRISAKK